MKKIFVYAFAICAIGIASCKGSGSAGSNDSIDTAQMHVGNQNPTDSATLPVTPTETGGKDSTGMGQGTTNMPKDTIKTQP